MTFTYLVPIVSILPGAFIETIVASFIGDTPYSVVGQWTLNTFIIFYIISVVLFLITARKKIITNGQIVIFLLFEFFIIHNIGFYLDWSSSGFRSDGQLLFGVINTFPYSSIGFFGLGIAIDLVKKKTP